MKEAFKTPLCRNSEIDVADAAHPAPATPNTTPDHPFVPPSSPARFPPRIRRAAPRIPLRQIARAAPLARNPSNADGRDYRADPPSVPISDDLTKRGGTAFVRRRKTPPGRPPRRRWNTSQFEIQFSSVPKTRWAPVRCLWAGPPASSTAPISRARSGGGPRMSELARSMETAPNSMPSAPSAHRSA